MLKGKTTSLKLNLKQEKFVNGFIPPFDKKNYFCFSKTQQKDQSAIHSHGKNFYQGNHLLCFHFNRLEN